MWKLGVDQAQDIFVRRERFRKYQATQKVVKDAAEKTELRHFA